ncbi:MAG: galactokinase [Candidatus Omnitrophica bacterium]|nr:galactokinase [Candidatus Omnitrophota bacterium]
MKTKIEDDFRGTFGEKEPFCSATTPGRANLIGEHIDYQGGYVFPIAVDRFIASAGRLKDDGRIKLFSCNYSESFKGPAGNIEYQTAVPWANYVLGVLAEFKKLGHPLPGIEIAFGGDIPIGSGLSSSAALEVCIAELFRRLSGAKISPEELIKLARRAENEFVGVNCGIMDQFSVYLAKEKHALLLNCKTLAYENIPLPLGNLAFLLVDTKKERKLSSSVYNERVKSVEESLDVIKKREPVDFLTEVEDINRYKNVLSAENFKRARHIAEENRRVLDAVKKLGEKDMDGFGRLMYESHKSLRELYEVSCCELDFIVDFSKKFDGVKGARLTGAGMGGCCIILLEEKSINKFKEQLANLYKDRFGFPPEFYEISAVNGAFYRNC